MRVILRLCVSPCHKYIYLSLSLYIYIYIKTKQKRESKRADAKNQAKNTEEDGLNKFPVGVYVQTNRPMEQPVLISAASCTFLA
ncbi:hypothetical protein E2320_000748, partial [Naja naja]